MKIFTQLPEELFDHILWKETKKKKDWRWALIAILRRAALVNQSDLIKGQATISIRQVSDDAEITKKQAEKAIRFWLGITAQNKKRVDGACVLREVFGGQKRGQKRGQEKAVYNILLKGYCENEGTEKGTEKGMGEGTQRGHKGDSPPRENQTEAKKLEESLQDSFINAPGAVDSGAPTRRFFALDEKTMTFTGMSKKDIEGWREHYRYLNPLDYLDDMATWLLKNKPPEYRANIPRKFFTNWLSKHNETNQKNLDKGKSNDDRHSLAQGQGNKPQGKFINGNMDETPLVAGAGFYDKLYPLPKMQKK
jgi:hypothetical protein